MKLKVQFPGYQSVPVDTENATCSVFEKLTATEAARALEEAVMGDGDDNGGVETTIGGERCYIERA